MGYSFIALEIIQSATFRKWLSSLKDRNARARIHVRLDRMRNGNFGDVKSVGGGICEARIAYGPGYRLYFLRQGTMIIVMLAGGDKRSQTRDINRAKEMADQWK